MAEPLPGCPALEEPEHSQEERLLINNPPALPLQCPGPQEGAEQGSTGLGWACMARVSR